MCIYLVAIVLILYFALICCGGRKKEVALSKIMDDGQRVSLAGMNPLSHLACLPH
jgi:hypothetical protein